MMRFGVGLAFALLSGPAMAEGALVPAPFPTTTYNPHYADIAGAGVLELPGEEPALIAFDRQFRTFGAHFDVTIARDGAILTCKAVTLRRAPKAGIALCNHVKSKGHFKKHRWLDLPFYGGTARYRMTGYHDAVDQTFSYFTRARVGQQNVQVFFPREGVPLEAQQVPGKFVARPNMDYPIWALRAEITGTVEAMVTFGEDGRVAFCRPLHSTNTLLLAFDTCGALQLSKLDVTKTPLRKWVVKTRWMLPD